jgi:hypothetical protein
LINPKAKGGERGNHVIKDVTQNPFVVGPSLLCTENVNLNGKPVFVGRELPNEKGHVLADFGVRGQPAT